MGTREKLFIGESGQTRSKIRVDHGRNYALFPPFCAPKEQRKMRFRRKTARFVLQNSSLTQVLTRQIRYSAEQRIFRSDWRIQAAITTEKQRNLAGLENKEMRPFLVGASPAPNRTVQATDSD